MASSKMSETNQNSDGFNIQYACPTCDNTFSNEHICQKHTKDCAGAVLFESHGTRRSKRKHEESDTNLTNNKKSCAELIPGFENDNRNYEIYSKIISENEVLITLRYNDSSTSDNEAGDISQNNSDNLSIDNDLLNSSKQIGTCVDKSKTLTVLNPVVISKSAIEDNVKDKEYDENEDSESTHEENETAHDKVIKEEESDSTSSEQTVEGQNLTKLYKKIPNQPISKPINFGVYDFFDEEEELMKQKKIEEKEKQRELKRRTCNFCNQLFDDPIDVLRHKRTAHTFSKVIMSKEELAPYFDKEDRTECPICFKPLSKKGHQSLYVKHLMTHCNDYSFKCSICGTQFRRKDHWLNHEQRHIVKPQ